MKTSSKSQNAEWLNSSSGSFLQPTFLQQESCITMNNLVNSYFKTLADLLASESGHRTDSPLENGGWIYMQKRGKSYATFFRKAERSRRRSGKILLGNPPLIKDSQVIAIAHTHPYNQKEQELANSEGFNNTRESQVDYDKVYKALDLSVVDGIPNLVAYESNPKGIYNSRLKPGQIWIVVQGIGPDLICWRTNQ